MAGHHIYGEIRSQTIGFYKRLRNNCKLSIQRSLARCLQDNSCQTRRNINLIMSNKIHSDLYSLNKSFFDINKVKYKSNHKFEPIDHDEDWKVPLIQDLVDMKRNMTKHRPDSTSEFTFALDEIKSSLREICTN